MKKGATVDPMVLSGTHVMEGSGKVLVTFGLSKTLENSEKYPWSERVLSAGDVFNVQSECPYRLQALEESIMIEVGDRCDDVPVRLEDDYGRADAR